MHTWAEAKITLAKPLAWGIVVMGNPAQRSRDVDKFYPGIMEEGCEYRAILLSAKDKTFSYVPVRAYRTREAAMSAARFAAEIANGDAP
jgi:hypothetical protein